MDKLERERLQRHLDNLQTMRDEAWTRHVSGPNVVDEATCDACGAPVEIDNDGDDLIGTQPLFRAEALDYAVATLGRLLATAPTEERPDQQQLSATR